MKYQAIVDTSGYRILGHECFSEPIDERNWSAFASGWTEYGGLFFVSVPRLWMAACLQDLVRGGYLQPERIVFQVPDWDASVGEFPRRCGAKVSLNCAGATPGFLETVCGARPDFIRIDGCLARDVEQPESGAKIRKLVEISDSFGMKVIATGVSRPREVENLWLLGVEIMQGDLFGAPAPYAARMSADLNSLSQAVNSGASERLPAPLG